ncbi:hypothetical protein E2C01_074902 [Portunus trituberculatus]|uniref:Uncharacterized protein n=1 Tax=Portunus trituberculatus TaxID=210409 RepID=A0A5B7IIF5_PORTR|nr:hypothetical protein [Portunus trituberculatus]
MRHQKHRPSCKLQTDTSRRKQQPRRKTEETPTWPTADPEKYILSEAFTCNQSATGQRRAPGTPQALPRHPRYEATPSNHGRGSLATEDGSDVIPSSVWPSVWCEEPQPPCFQLALHPISQHLTEFRFMHSEGHMVRSNHSLSIVKKSIGNLAQHGCVGRVEGPCLGLPSPASVWETVAVLGGLRHLKGMVA